MSAHTKRRGRPAPGDAPFASEAIMRASCADWLRESAMAILQQQPAIAPAVMAYEAVVVVDERVPTAMTNGECLYFNPYFMATLSPDERTFVYAHELWHILLRHHDRQAGRDNRRWNLACDHEVNYLLEKCGFRSPAERFILRTSPLTPVPQTAEQAWALMEQWAAQSQGESGRPSSTQRSPHRAAASAVPDVSTVPEDDGQGVRSACPAPFSQPGALQSPEVTYGEGEFNADRFESRRRQRRQRPVGAATRASAVSSDAPAFEQAVLGCVDPRFPAGVWSPAATQKLARISTAIGRYLGTTAAGNEAGYARFAAPDGGRASVSWVDVLAQRLQAIVRQAERSSYPSRRGMHRGVYLPGISYRRAWRLAVAVDTSGSTIPEWATFVAELRSLAWGAGAMTIRYLECDVAVHRDELFEDPTALPSALTSLTGGGGTEFEPVFARLAGATDVDALIYFSDGDGPAPVTRLPFPVLRVWAGEMFEGMEGVEAPGSGRTRAAVVERRLRSLVPESKQVHSDPHRS